MLLKLFLMKGRGKRNNDNVQMVLRNNDHYSQAILRNAFETFAGILAMGLRELKRRLKSFAESSSNTIHIFCFFFILSPGILR